MIVIVIPAKGGSARLPNKNMAPINGRPMLDYTIDQALASRRADAVYVSTDSDAIAEHATFRGVKVIRRPETLGGETPIIEVYRHALREIGNPAISMVVGLQPDHPDRNCGVDETLDVFAKEGADVLKSTNADGTKNGAHYVVSRKFLESGTSTKTVSIIDDCTNVHYPDDLKRAAARLEAREGST